MAMSGGLCQETGSEEGVTSPRPSASEDEGTASSPPLHVLEYEELAKRKRALLWLMTPGNGASSERLRDYAKALEEIEGLQKKQLH